ncbi:MAG: hypothetical protein ACYC4L_21475 [Chloroflexota bacterium]
MRAGLERGLKWLLPLLVVAEVALVRLELLDLGTALWVAIGVEALLLIVGGRQLFVAWRRYRRERRAGLNPWLALEEGVAVLLPRPLARVVVLEPRLWAYLFLWLSRRFRRRENEFAYHKRSVMTTFLLLLAFTTPVELLLLELLVPWGWLRWLLLVLSVYALIWLNALYASLVVLPHRLEADGLRLRFGVLAEVLVPYTAIAEVTAEHRRAPGGAEGLRAQPEAGVAYLAANGTTDLTLRLRQPLSLQGLLNRTPPVTTLHVAVDEPHRLAASLATRLPAEDGGAALP